MLHSIWITQRSIHYTPMSQNIKNHWYMKWIKLTTLIKCNVLGCLTAQLMECTTSGQRMSLSKLSCHLLSQPLSNKDTKCPTNLSQVKRMNNNATFCRENFILACFWLAPPTQTNLEKELNVSSINSPHLYLIESMKNGGFLSCLTLKHWQWVVWERPQ